MHYMVQLRLSLGNYHQWVTGDSSKPVQQSTSLLKDRDHQKMYSPGLPRIHVNMKGDCACQFIYHSHSNLCKYSQQCYVNLQANRWSDICLIRGFCGILTLGAVHQGRMYTLIIWQTSHLQLRTSQHYIIYYTLNQGSPLLHIKA